MFVGESVSSFNNAVKLKLIYLTSRRTCRRFLIRRHKCSMGSELYVELVWFKVIHLGGLCFEYIVFFA